MKTIALFPGSFDPFTAGHLNILGRALTMFDEVVVAVGINQDKRGIDICRQLGIRHIVRGIRNMMDFDNEKAIADANRRLAPEIETIIIPTAQEFAHISSSAVRDLLRHHGDTSQFLPEGVVLPEAL